MQRCLACVAWWSRAEGDGAERERNWTSALGIELTITDARKSPFRTLWRAHQVLLYSDVSKIGDDVKSSEAVCARLSAFF